MSIPAAERCVRRRAVLRRTAGSGAAPAAVRAESVPPEDRKNPLPAFRSAFSSGRERMLLKEFLAPFRVKKLQTGKAAPAALRFSRWSIRRPFSRRSCCVSQSICRCSASISRSFLCSKSRHCAASFISLFMFKLYHKTAENAMFSAVLHLFSVFYWDDGSA